MARWFLGLDPARVASTLTRHGGKSVSIAEGRPLDAQRIAVATSALERALLPEGEATKESAPLHACLHCGRHPATHAPANADSDDACPGCGLGDALEP